MRKAAFCICENKDADQLRGNREADQRLCFRYTDSKIPLLPKSEISSISPFSVAVRFVSDLVRNPRRPVSSQRGSNVSNDQEPVQSKLEWETTKRTYILGQSSTRTVGIASNFQET